MSKWKGLLYMGKDLSDYFLINSKGELLNKKTGRILKYSINNQTGYLQVCVSMGSRKSKKIITPADEKTHGFNRVDDSPQIFNYVQMYILKISTRYAILNL